MARGRGRLAFLVVRVGLRGVALVWIVILVVNSVISVAHAGRAHISLGQVFHIELLKVLLLHTKQQTFVFLNRSDIRDKAMTQLTWFATKSKDLLTWPLAGRVEPDDGSFLLPSTAWLTAGAIGCSVYEWLLPCRS